MIEVSQPISRLQKLIPSFLRRTSALSSVEQRRLADNAFLEEASDLILTPLGHRNGFGSTSEGWVDNVIFDVNRIEGVVKGHEIQLENELAVGVGGHIWHNFERVHRAEHIKGSVDGVELLSDEASSLWGKYMRAFELSQQRAIEVRDGIEKQRGDEEHQRYLESDEHAERVKLAEKRKALAAELLK